MQSVTIFVFVFMAILSLTLSFSVSRAILLSSTRQPTHQPTSQPSNKPSPKPSASSFPTPVTRQPTRQLSMVWGKIKLGQSVLKEVPVKIEDTTVHSHVIKTASIGTDRAGFDERSFEQNEEIEFESLSKIDLSLRRMNLLRSLSSTTLSQNVKFDMVSNAFSESLISSQFTVGGSISSSSVKAGGLNKDWEFDFE